MAEKKSYAEQVAEYREARREREAMERRSEIEREYSDLVEQRDAAAQTEDADTFDFVDKQLEELEAEYNQLTPAPQPAPTFTDVEAGVIRQYSPQQYGQPHWTSQSRYNVGQKFSNEEIVRSGAAYAQSRYVADRTRRGLQTTPQDLETYRNSPEYRAALEVIAPAEKAGVPDADEVLKTINATSKHKLDAKTYNRYARELQRRKGQGDYPD